MFNQIFNDDSIHTQNAYELEIRVRAREEQRFMLVENFGKEEAGRVKGTSNLSKAVVAGIFSNPRVFMQALAGTIRK